MIAKKKKKLQKILSPKQTVAARGRNEQAQQQPLLLDRCSGDNCVSKPDS
jgi:hypothetical protein